MAVACNATLPAPDEMGEVNGEKAGETVCMPANGRAKVRADRDGTARSAPTWKVPILSGGGSMLADRMAEDGRRIAAGRDVRLSDLAAIRRRFGGVDDLHGARDGGASGIFAARPLRPAARRDPLRDRGRLAGIHAGADPRRAAEHLAAAGLLRRGDGRDLERKAPRGAPGRPRGYAVKVAILGGGDEGDGADR